MSTLPQNPHVRPIGPSGAKVLRFKKATKEAAKLRLALVGASGSGKTYTALAIAQGLGGKVAVIDTERGSASKYAGATATPHAFEFDTLELESFHPQGYIDAIRAAEEAGYDIVILDSLSHAWMGRDGALELVDRVAKKNPRENKFTAWADVTPLQNDMLDAILRTRCHVIATMRAKTEWVLEPDARGRMVPRKVGIAPVQRDGVEFEFDVVCNLSQENELSVIKTRCSALAEKTFPKAGRDVAAVLRGWLDSAQGAPPPPPVPRSMSEARENLSPPMCPPAGNPSPVATPDAMTAEEGKVVHEIGPSVAAATTEETVEALRKHALSLLPANAQGKAEASAAYIAWHKLTFGAAFTRVGGAR